MTIVQKPFWVSVVLCALAFYNTTEAQVRTYPVQNNARLDAFHQANPDYTFQPKSMLKFGTLDTMTLPFFDDFSESTLYPDSTKWFNNQVYVNNHFPKLPPSYNVATFDALDYRGVPYRNTLNKDYSAAGDSLISQPINLKDSMGKAYTLSDSIILSFYYQPNGYGYHLSSEDSIRLWFKAKNGLWFQVWSQGGRAASEPFEQVWVSIQDENFLHAGFQFMFTTFTKQVGNANHWHIDYVYLDNQRSSAISYYNDYAIQTTPTSLLKDYYAMPYSHYLANVSKYTADTIHFRVSNLYKDAKSLFVRHEANSNGETLVDTKFESNTNNHAAQNSRFRNLAIYPIDNIPATNPIVINRTIQIEENGLINDYRANDNIDVTQEFYDYYAYDDGTAERGFGFDHNTNPSNIEGQIAYEFEITKTDTLYALSTFFNKAVFDVSDKRFRYRIWSSLQDVSGATEDELIFESEDQNPVYTITNGRRTFTPFYLDTTLVLAPGKYYIGWWQSNIYNLNVGWDMNFGNVKDPEKPNPKIYHNTIAGWRNTQLPNGTLMMRPHFGNQRELYASVFDLQTNDNKPKIYPNPAREMVFFGKKFSSATLVDNMGNVVLSQQNTKQLNIQGVESGMYFVRLTTKDQKQFVSKLIIIAP